MTDKEIRRAISNLDVTYGGPLPWRRWLAALWRWRWIRPKAWWEL